MRSPSVLVVATLILLGSACKKDAAKPAPTAGSAAAPVAVDGGAAPVVVDTASLLPRPYLWRVEKDGKTNHVLGTMHLGIDAEKSLPPWVWSRLDAAKTFVMEVDATDPSLVGAVLRSDGSSLQKELGPEHWAKLEKVLGADMAKRFDGLKASAVAVMITLQGLPMTAPMDLVLSQRAKSGDKQVVYLEDPQTQQTLLDKWMDARALKAMLDDVPKVRRKNEELLAAYRSGDDGKLQALVDDESQWKDMGLDAKAAEVAMNELLYDRNRNWIAPLEKLLANGEVFVAVGVAHLIGEGSVLALLEKQGYTVSRVTGP